MAKTSKAAQIRAHFQKHPQATPKTVARVFKANLNQVYNIRSELNKAAAVQGTLTAEEAETAEDVPGVTTPPLLQRTAAALPIVRPMHIVCDVPPQGLNVELELPPQSNNMREPGTLLGNCVFYPTGVRFAFGDASIASQLVSYEKLAALIDLVTTSRA